jgi:hypothetical protein
MPETDTPKLRSPALAEAKVAVPVVDQPLEIVRPMDAFLNPAVFNQLQRAAALLASSRIVPAQFQGDAPSCFIILQLAQRMGLEPFMLMQTSYVVHGRPGLEAKAVIAIVNSSGRFAKPLNWRLEGQGADRSATCYTVRNDGEPVECSCTMRLAQAEGWIDKAGSKWKTMPDMMLQYRSAAMFARLHCPEVLMGMSTTDELADIGPAEPFPGTERPSPKDVPPPQEAGTKTEKMARALKERRGRQRADRDGPQEPSEEGGPAQGQGEAEKTQPEAAQALQSASCDDGRAADADLPSLRQRVVEAGKALGLNLDDVQRRAGCGIAQWTERTCNKLLADLDRDASLTAREE